MEFEINLLKLLHRNKINYYMILQPDRKYCNITPHRLILFIVALFSVQMIYFLYNEMF
jgi:hypothetical protein